MVLLLRDEYGNGASSNGRRTRSNNIQVPLDEKELSISVINGDTLQIGNVQYNTGEMIVVVTPDSTQLTGTISSLAPKEVWITIDDDAKLKITVSQLQNARYTIKKHQSDQAASL